MGHASKRLASTAAKLTTVSLAHLPKFPPKESLFKPPVEGSPPHYFSPTTWASQQPPPPSALSAFAHRIGLSSVLTCPETIQQACTHPSFASSIHASSNTTPASPTRTLRSNAQLATVGNALMGLFASEHMHAAYPYLPTRVLKAAITAHVGPLTCASVAQEMGVTPLLRWHRTPNTPTSPAVLHTDALASVPRAITALVYQQRSLHAARTFVHSFFLGREIDLRGMIKFRDPKKALAEMVQKFDRQRPTSRLLKETGRFSNSPIFVVGIYSGPEQIGEGFGSSLKMAEFRAAEDALHRVYLTRTPNDLIQLPSSTFPRGSGDVFQRGPEGDYQAPELPAPEIMYASSGRTGMVAAKQAELE